MAFEHWNSLSDSEKMKIAQQAQKEHDACGRRKCYWCGEPFTFGYEHTFSARDPREICKGYCRKRRFFDNPENA